MDQITYLLWRYKGKTKLRKGPTMPRRYLAFDIETAKQVPGEDFNWRPHRPLGICCAATLASDAAQPIHWHGKTPDGRFAKKMTRADAKGLADYLAKMAAQGYKVLTWNGAGFDFDILAEESAADELCKQQTLAHVDMMFHFFCVQGYPDHAAAPRMADGSAGDAFAQAGYVVDEQTAVAPGHDGVVGGELKGGVP